MLIVLYDDSYVKRESPKVASRVYIKKASEFDTRSWGSLGVPASVCGYFDSLLKVSTRYDTLRNLRYDRLMPVELLCVGKNAKKFCIHLDLRSRLDLVLSSLCGVDPSRVSCIPNYERLSHALLDVAVTKIDDTLTLEHLLEVDEVRDFYVGSGFLRDPGKFLDCILGRCQDIVWYLSSYLCIKCIAKSQSAIRSFRPAESVIFSNELVDEVINVGIGEYSVPIKLKCYAPLEYLAEVSQ